MHTYEITKSKALFGPINNYLGERVAKCWILTLFIKRRTLRRIDEKKRIEALEMFTRRVM